MKWLIWRSYFLMLVILMIFCACADKNAVQTPESVRERGALRVAACNEYNYPYLYWENELAMGIEAEMARALASALQVDVEFTPFEKKDIEDAVASGVADMGIAGIRKGSTRKKSLIETGCYYNLRAFIITRRGEAYPNDTAMKSRNIIFAEGYDYKAASTADVNAGVEKLINGDADAVVCDEFSAYAYVDESDGRLQAELYQNSDDYEYVAVLAKQNEKLYAFIDKEINDLVQSGKMRETVYDK